MPDGELIGAAAASAGRRPVLVPLDGSPLAERAVPWAVAIATRCQAPLLLTQAVRLGYTVAPDAADAALIESALESARQAAVAYVGGTAAGLRATAPDLEVRTAVRLGDPPSVLLGLEHEVDPPVVVMSTHGRGGLERWIRGSVAEAVLRRGTAPVLLVRPSHDASRAARLGRHGGRVLVPLDGSDLAARALPEAFRVAAPGGGEIVLTTVVHPEEAGHARAEGQVAARRRLDAIALDLRHRGLPASAVVLTADGAAQAIVDLATLEEIDLIVMATHGRGGLGRWRYGSVADAVSRTAPCPVLLVRPPGAGERPAGSAPLATRRPAAPLAAGRGKTAARAARTSGVLPLAWEAFVGTRKLRARA